MPRNSRKALFSFLFIAALYAAVCTQTPTFAQNAWLQNFRRVATRFEYHAENYHGFVHLGCIKILLRCYL